MSAFATQGGHNNQKAPQGGWRSSPPACMASLIFEVQKPCDLDLGSGQGHISMRNTCSTTCMPNHLTVASLSTETWPFEFREIWTFREVWTLVIAFVEGNSKIWLGQAIDQSHTITIKDQFLAPHESGWGDISRNVQLCATVGRSSAPKSATFAILQAPWPWPWLGSDQHTQYV